MNAMIRAALGLRAHSGWAALVAIVGPPGSPDVVLRRRVQLVLPNSPGAAQPFHAAAEMELSEGEELVRGAIASSKTLAAKALRELIVELRRKKDCETVGCGIVAASGRPLPALPLILASHALIHTAEGEMFRQALADASRRCHIEPVRIPEKELVAAAKAGLGLSEDQLKGHLAELGRRIGPSWRQDEKQATLVAALALHAASR